MASRAPGAGEARVVLVTAPVEGARGLARTLVAERLAACVNVVGDIHSLYRFQGAVHEDAESLLIIKTTEARLAALVERVGQLHPYELPEVVALPVAGGSAPYLAWLAAETEE